ncbi:hypothetical protein GWI33_023236 [Rhynchophorus ferrugineus]|uniref:BHLH domain-containing protein n=1 Tax=Rhynchophorus ferrugineus TaxID=354439 RepID=A0A834MII9_RHYFE|nr:hypothetical protein GWI33_023236 [Rhynchophorus ferrugineus]
MTNGNNKLIIKESDMASSIHHEDTGFCSGEDYMENEVHSPTDSSEDSVEVKVSTITFKPNKRRLPPEPPQKKELLFSGPLKKRMCLKVKAEEENSDANSAPFRPWSPRKIPAAEVPVVSSSFATPFPLKVESSSAKTEAPISSFSYFRPPSPTPFAQQQSEPVALVIKRESDEDRFNNKSSEMRVPIHPEICTLSTAETERLILKTNEQFPGLQSKPSSSLSTSNCVNPNLRKPETKREQRNYKNMTRERRIEANARERTRVHTISAAFDTLRRAIPSYSHNQKLSKLSVLRIACSYIMTLSSIVDDDDSGPPTSEYVDMVSRTIQREGKLRKKKDDND